MATGIMNRLFASGLFGNKGSGPPTPTPVAPVPEIAKKRKTALGEVPFRPPTSLPKPPKGSTLLTAGAGAPAVRNTLLGQ